MKTKGYICILHSPTVIVEDPFVSVGSSTKFAAEVVLRNKPGGLVLDVVIKHDQGNASVLIGWGSQELSRSMLRPVQMISIE